MAALGGKIALVVGVGGLGGPAALALAAGGVGTLLLADAGAVEEVDLAAQPLLSPGDLGRPRADAAAGRLARLFPTLRSEPWSLGADGAAAALVSSADVVVDASNRFATMFAVNDAAVAAARPLAHGGVLHLTAHLLTVVPGATGCLRCLFEAPPPPAPTRAPAGPLAPFVGALLGAEALRLLHGRPGIHAGVLHAYEARSGRSRAVPVHRRAGCPACAGRSPLARAEVTA